MYGGERGAAGETGGSARAAQLAECGLAAAHLFTDAGLDPRQWTGLALGMGLDRTLTDLEANRIRDDVYLALHEGPVRELITG